MSDLPEFILERTFSAPRALVWQAWTDPTLLAKWYGPNIETVIHKFDLEPEGQWLNEMRMPSGSNFQKVVFKEVVAPEKLVWHHYSSVDADWNEIPSTMMQDWPHLLLTTVTFTEEAGATHVRLSQVPLDCSPAEIETFAQMMEGMSGGWGAGYALIDEILSSIQN